MATTKATTTAKAAEKKVEAKAVEAKKTTTAAKAEVKAEAKTTTAAKAAEKKVETKTAAKAPAKKAETKTAAKAPAKKAETKTAAKAPAKKAAAKPAAKKTTAKKESALFVEFAEKQLDVETIKANAIADYKAKSGVKTAPKSVKIYVKPADAKAYYVIDDVFGDVAL